MAIKINAKQLADTVSKLLEDYNDEVIQIMNDEGKKIAKEGAKELKRISPNSKRTRGTRTKYNKSWSTKEDKAPINAKKMGAANTNTIYSKKPNYRLTHLLENGHLTRSGKRTKSYPHAKITEKNVIDRFSKNVEEAIKNG
jgi:hypothetical protein